MVRPKGPVADGERVLVADAAACPGLAGLLTGETPYIARSREPTDGENADSGSDHLATSLFAIIARDAIESEHARERVASSGPFVRLSYTHHMDRGHYGILTDSFTFELSPHGEWFCGGDTHVHGHVTSGDARLVAEWLRHFAHGQATHDSGADEIQYQMESSESLAAFEGLGPRISLTGGSAEEVLRAWARLAPQFGEMCVPGAFGYDSEAKL
jgi:hypothetical protein